MVVGAMRNERDEARAIRPARRGGAAAAIGRAGAVALALLLLCLAAAGGARAAALDSLTIATSTGAHTFQVEIAATEAAREKGLMLRRFLPANRGMLFEFDRVEPVAFWMKNTYVPLDIIFIARDGTVSGIAADAEPLSETIIPSGVPCAAALEVNAGVAARIGLKVGDKVRHPFFKP
jgi:hypothetical protein